MKDKDIKLARVFIGNTLKALEQYQTNLGTDEQSYSHTLFINACVGFLVVANEAVLEELPKSEINEKEWGISLDDIKVIRGDKSVYNVAMQMRHSIAHFNFSYEYSEMVSMPIENITFKNWHNNFETEAMSFIAFKTFVFKIAKETLRIIDSKLQ